jgi:hypothetical protein
LGQTCRKASAQRGQKVHSYTQIQALPSGASAARQRSHWLRI